MKIVIASLGRAHLLDCARELQKQGNNVVFFSATPKSKLINYGLVHGAKSLSWLVLPVYLIKRFIHTEWSQNIYRSYLDFWVSIQLPKCDVFIAQSPNFMNSMKKAKKLYNAVTILDRGTSHVRYYNKLCPLYGAALHSEAYQKYDESQYYIADYIAVASDFVVQSFLNNSFHLNRLFLNPYGVSFSHFYPTACTNEFDFIVVGQWSRRKGSHLIVDSFISSSLKVLHVGSIIDVPFPVSSNFVHIDSVEENRLVNYYQKAKVFLFPSFEDGYGLVLNQAVACGLPIVCSKHCGGPTLKKAICDVKYICIMDELTSSELVKASKYALEICKEQSGKRTYKGIEDKIGQISWEAYGKRYEKFLENIQIR